MANSVFGLKGVIATKSAVQSIASGVAGVSVNFDVETFDTSGDTEKVKFHSIVATADENAKFYAVEDGFYELSANVKFAVVASGRVGLGYSIDTGATVLVIEQPGGTASEPGLYMVKTLKLSAGQYVTLKAYQSSGAAVNIVVAGTEVVFKKM